MKAFWCKWSLVIGGVIAACFLLIPIPDQYVNFAKTLGVYLPYGGVYITVLSVTFDWVVRNRDGFDVIFAFIVAIFTWVLASKTSGLFAETAKMRAAAEQQKIDIQRSTEATEKAASAAESTVLKMEDTAIRQLRAYILVQKSNATNIGIGMAPAAKVTIKNFGQTPAYNLSVWGSIGVHYYPPTLPIPEPEESETAKAPLGPDAVMHINAKLQYTLDNLQQLEEIRKGNMAIYITGRVSYTDAFEIRRSTIFCFYTTDIIGTIGNFSPYVNGNESD